MMIDCHPDDETDVREYAAYIAERRRLASALWAARRAADPENPRREGRSPP